VLGRLAQEIKIVRFMQSLRGSSIFAVLAALVVCVAYAGMASSGEKDLGDGVTLHRLSWNQLTQKLANKEVKYTLVDAWSTTCGPCKENFPHVLEMSRKYGSRGLSVISLSLDDPADKDAVAEAEKFLKQKKAHVTNVLLDEAFGDGFDKLSINGIPAVFIYGPDGKEVKRFTMDDPNNQFTYDEVEKAVVALLAAKP
jgi:thiol-disulfide isomerase/thioredoxin